MVTKQSLWYFFTAVSEPSSRWVAVVTRPAWVTEGIDLSRPSASRVYDYYLGGFHNFSSDREMAEQAIKDWPDLPLIMRCNRAFLRRAVTWLVGRGVRQFLDIGSGIPTVGNVHEVAQALDPGARVVYVDIDPVAVAHSEAILSDNPNAIVVKGDFTDPAGLLSHRAVRDHLDLEQPAALLLVSLLHFVGDDADPARLIATFRDAMAPGSFLALSHATHELHPPELTGFHRDLYRRTATPMTMRSRAQVEAFFDGYDLVEPGVVLGETWHATEPVSREQAERVPLWAGIGRKPVTGRRAGA
jgi:S-adenosyl methyltransferase